MKIRKGTKQDIPVVTSIYNHYIEKTVITFEMELISETTMLNRFETITKKHPFLVGELNGTIVGFAYASPWRSREAYRNSVETTVYLSSNKTGNGYGILLLEELIKQLKQLKCHAVMAGIALPNEASVKIHERLGFQKVAHFKQVGHKFNKWIDVAYWELLL